MGLSDTAYSRQSGDSGRDGEGAMGFLEHLEELRSRLIRSCIAIAGGMAVAYSVVDRIEDFVLAPARFLWQRIQYAILIIFIVAAVLTPAPDPWNQFVLAAPMLAMYAISIGVAWLAGRGSEKRPATSHLRLVVAAGVLAQARRSRPVRLCR
jgi:Sec-independent protein secretion pathway component TatC